MGVKKKFNGVKAKIKTHAPAIIAVVSAGVAGYLAVTNHRLKTEHAAQIDEWVEHDKARDNEIHLPEDYAQLLKEGHTGHLTSPFYDFCLTIQKHNHPED
jgi:hypothetical protein